MKTKMFFREIEIEIKSLIDLLATELPDEKDETIEINRTVRKIFDLRPLTDEEEQEIIPIKLIK